MLIPTEKTAKRKPSIPTGKAWSLLCENSFESQAEAARFFCVSSAQVSRRCNGLPSEPDKLTLGDWLPYIVLVAEAQGVPSDVLLKKAAALMEVHSKYDGGLGEVIEIFRKAQ